MIPIQNIYYMLTYAFRTLDEKGYQEFGTEDFENMGELCAAILAKGVLKQVKRGLGKEYREQTEILSCPRGKIEIAESIKALSIQRRQLACTYDEFTHNSYLNQIIKTTMLFLLRADISVKYKKQLRKVLVYFDGVDTLDIHNINWNHRYDRNNQTYKMLINICYLVIKGLLQTQADGKVKLMDFMDEQTMYHLYEKFILEYYKKEFSHYRKGFPKLNVNADRIPWILDEGSNANLPIMQSDITISSGDKVLIIDAKYYEQTMQERFGSRTLRSAHLYQIFTYVKNKEAELSDREHEVSGMVLYAKTDEDLWPDDNYVMSGNKISLRTLDLNVTFKEIREQLDGIIKEYFE